jgi:membrane protein
MDPSLPSPSTPPPTPPDSAKDAERSQVAENLRNAKHGTTEPAVGVATPAVTPETQVAQTKKGWWGAILETFNKFSDDDIMTQAAALAFYTGLSLAPLLTVIVWVMQIATPVDAKAKIEEYAINIVGPQSKEVVKSVVNPGQVPDEAEVERQATTNPAARTDPTTVPDDPNTETEAEANMTLAGIASIVFLAFTASGVLAQLQSSLNLIWSVKPDPSRSGIVILIRKRVFSFGMLFTVLFLLLVSMLVTFVINVVIKFVFGEDVTFVAQLTNIGITLAIATGVFMLLFTYLPDVRVPWRDTLFGAALTAVLFIVGRFVIGQVLSRSDYSTSYGATIGSFLALLVWVYYTSIIMFLGVEATTVFTRRRGHDPKPEKHAVRTLRTARIIARPDEQPPTHKAAIVTA